MPEIKENNAHLFDHYTSSQKQQLYEAASELFSENKRDLFDRLVQNRTRHLTVVLEDIFQSHNASAVLRSCDCFGVQDVHVIENNNKYSVNPDVSMGSNKWVDYYKYSGKNEDNTLKAFRHLKSQGYKIVATLPHENDTMLQDLDVSQPVALVFGTELTGLSQVAIDNADAYVKIPMYGFTESFNISVCAALSIFYLTEKMRSTPGLNWQLTPEEQLTLKLYWSMQVIHSGEDVLAQLISRLGLPPMQK